MSDHKLLNYIRKLLLYCRCTVALGTLTSTDVIYERMALAVNYASVFVAFLNAPYVCTKSNQFDVCANRY